METRTHADTHFSALTVFKITLCSCRLLLAIRGNDSLCVCASQAEEVKKLSGDRSGFYQTGLYIAGQKCLMIRDQLDVDGSYSLDLKTTGDAEGNKYSVCVGKSNKGETEDGGRKGCF